MAETAWEKPKPSQEFLALGKDWGPFTRIGFGLQEDPKCTKLGQFWGLLEAVMSVEVEGTVLEVLLGLGLAHVRTPDGHTYGLTRDTPGVRLDDLSEGQHVRLEVEPRFSRVLQMLA